MRVFLALFSIALLAIAGVRAIIIETTTNPPHGGPTPTPTPTSTPPPLVPNLERAIGQMAQYDIVSFLIDIPPGVTNEQPTADGITFPPAAIEYGLWINETKLGALINDSAVGSLFNSPVSQGTKAPPGASWWRALQARLYEMSKSTSPILFGLDSVHGVNYAFGATLFPQSIGTAATFDDSCAFNVGNVTSRESRYIGIPWTFAPILGIAVQPSWPRVFETFGEDPYLASRMGASVITGIQQPPPASMFPDVCSPSNRSINCPSVAVAACMKHFIGYSNPRTGRDRTPAWMPHNVMLQFFAPSFQAAIDAGVLTAMENYIAVNGRPVVSSYFLLNFLLRASMRFGGMLVTDYNEIYELKDFHMTADSYLDAVRQAINATSIDMGMFSAPTDYPSTITENIAKLWQDGEISTLRISNSSNRVQQLKAILGLYAQSPVPPEQTSPTDSWRTRTATPANETCFYGCPEHHAMALDAARKSMTLLQNSGILPLTNTSKKLAVIGKGCNSVPIMAGGWTVHWQGSHNPADFPYGSTILQELANHFESISYAEGCNITEESTCDSEALSLAVRNAAAADFVILCLGESQYAEVVGDINDQTLPGQQIQLAQAVAQVNPRIVTVLIEGRPRVLGPVPDLSLAVLMAYLPGPFGGQAIVETLMGVNNPSGRLPITYPRHLSAGPIQYWRAYSSNQFNDYDPQWPFGHGIGYSAFKYSNMTAEYSGLSFTFNVSVDVTNVGQYVGTDVVLLYSTQLPRAHFPSEVKRLRNFTRVILNPGQTQKVKLAFGIKDLTYYDDAACLQLDTRNTFVTVGNADPFQDMELTKNIPAVALIKRLGCPLAGYYSDPEGAELLPKNPKTAPSPPSGDSDDYFMSSVVCFVGGVIATCFLVFFVRKRNRYMRADNVQLFEPSGV